METRIRPDIVRKRKLEEAVAQARRIAANLPETDDKRQMARYVMELEEKLRLAGDPDAEEPLDI